MVLNATFNNISVISWPSVLLVEKNRVPGENHHIKFDLAMQKILSERTTLFQNIRRV
jgi:hypothetical protein